MNTNGSIQTHVPRLARLHAALLTPYDAEEEISYRCLRRLVAHVKSQGIDGFYVGGSTGEGLLQTVEERLQVLETVAESASGSALIGHVGALSTRDAKALARGCAKLGYDAVSAIPPIYFPHQKEAIFSYHDQHNRHQADEYRHVSNGAIAAGFPERATSQWI